VAHERQIRYGTTAALLALHLLTGSPAAAGTVMPAPPGVQAAVFLKLLAFHKGIAASDSVVVYVVGSDQFAAEMSKGIGKPVGNAELAKVHSGTGKPGQKPSVVYIGDASKAGELLAYTRENDVLSITGIPELSEQGATLTVGIQDGKLKVFYNAGGAAEEGATWETGLFKVVEGGQDGK